MFSQTVVIADLDLVFVTSSSDDASGLADHKNDYKLIGPLVCIYLVYFIVGSSFSWNPDRLSYSSGVTFIVFCENV